MKRLLLLLLVPILILGLACNDDDKDDDKGIFDPGSSEAAGDIASIYYPLKADASWAYQSTFIDSGVVKEERENLIMTAGRQTFDDKEYWKIVDSQGHSHYARIDNNVLYTLYVYEESSEKAAVMAKAAGIIEEGEEPYIDFNAGVGESWVIEDSSKTGDEGTVTMKWTGTYLGTEDVTVPVGPFANCRKYSIYMALTFGDESSFVTTRTEWLAANVGVVKSVVTSDFDGPQYESLTMLKEYSIP